MLNWSFTVTGIWASKSYLKYCNLDLHVFKVGFWFQMMVYSELNQTSKMELYTKKVNAAIKYFPKKLHLRCLTDFWIRLCIGTMLKVKHFDIFITFEVPAMLGTNFKGALEKAPKLHQRHSPKVGPTFN